MKMKGIIKMDNNTKNRNKIIKARVTEDEELLVKTKAKIYGYRNLSKYLIDAAIYEKVTYVDLENQNLIYDAYAQNTKELKKFVNKLENIKGECYDRDIDTGNYRRAGRQCGERSDCVYYIYDSDFGA